MIGEDTNLELATGDLFSMSLKPGDRSEVFEQTEDVSLKKILILGQLSLFGVFRKSYV